MKINIISYFNNIYFKEKEFVLNNKGVLNIFMLFKRFQKWIKSCLKKNIKCITLVNGCNNNIII